MKVRRIAGTLFVAAVAFAACGGDDTVSTETVSPPEPPAQVPPDASDPASSPQEPATPAPTPAPPTGDVGPPSQPAAPADVPSVEVARIPSGEAVNLQTLAQGNDTLFWFWAPH